MEERTQRETGQEAEETAPEQRPADKAESAIQRLREQQSSRSTSAKALR